MHYYYFWSGILILMVGFFGMKKRSWICQEFELLNSESSTSPRCFISMVKELFTAEQKRSILSLYSTRRSDRSFSALARRFVVPGGKGTLSRWWKASNHNQLLLTHKKGQGRPRILNRSQVARYVHQPIRRKNRSHHGVHYPDLLPRIQQSTGKKVSIQTLRRYGKKDRGVKNMRTKKTTANECKCTMHTKE